MPCDSPFWVLPKGGVEKVPVPCGRCPPCKKRRVDGWVFRLLKEHLNYSDAHFVTLTYNTSHVPVSPNGFMTLNKKEFPLFMKRLRKLCPGIKLKYYACGEYGSQGSRPHYHAIIFGVPNPDLFFDAWTVDGVPIGGVHVGHVAGESIAYTMKYIDKPARVPLHSRDDRVPEFALMSKGLGSSYVTDAVRNYHGQDYSRLYLTRPDGVKIAMPRYYRDRIYNADDGGHQLALIRQAVAENEARQYQDFLRLTKSYPDSYTFEQHKDNARLARYKRFYSQLKQRDFKHD